MERQTSFHQFKVKFGEIIHPLQSVSPWQDLEAVSRARSLVPALLNSTFIVTVVFVCVYQIISPTRAFSKLLICLLKKQINNIDLKYALKQLNVITTLSEKCNTSELYFIKLFKEASEIADKTLTEIIIHRSSKHQCKLFEKLGNLPH